nr:glycosyltransferase [Tatumella sp. JGM130]
MFELYNKVLFIDADTIVESDVSELIDIDLGNNLVAAVRDIVMEGFLKFGAIADSSCGTMPARKYLISVLGMTHPEQYFQAGIILFNIVQMSAENTYQRLIDEIKDKYYWFLDQDIMNKVFYDRVHYLPLEWNVYHGNGNTDDFYPNLRLSTYLDFLKARMNPKMIHFAGENKPWNTKDVDYFDNFESYLNSTPWSSELTQRLYPRVINNVYNAQEKYYFRQK